MGAVCLWRLQGSSERPSPVPSPVIDMDNSSEVQQDRELLNILVRRLIDTAICSRLQSIMFIYRWWRRLQACMQKDWCQTWSWWSGNKNYQLTDLYYVPPQKSFRFSHCHVGSFVAFPAFRWCWWTKIGQSTKKDELYWKRLLPVKMCLRYWNTVMSSHHYWFNVKSQPE